MLEGAPFIFPVNFMNHIFQTSVLLIGDKGIYNRTWLIMQTYQKGQKQPTSHSCTELNKTVFPVSICQGYNTESHSGSFGKNLTPISKQPLEVFCKKRCS